MDIQRVLSMRGRRPGAGGNLGDPPARARPRPFFDDFAWWDQGDVLTQITPTRFSYIRSVAGNLSGSQVLDLACGGGLLSEPMARSGALVTGIDISSNSLRTARAHSRRGGLEIDFLQAPAEKLPFQDDSFDVVVAFDALEHVDDLPRVIGEAARVLRPGGKFIYDTMNRTFLCRLVVIWIGEHLWKGGPPRGTHQYHKLIKPGELTDLMAANGIANQETRGLVPMGINLKGHLVMKYVPFKGISYVGYGVKLG